jgi:hypothetical protein
VVLYASSELSSRWEQAKTPGEKDLGVDIPMLISAAGLLCLLIGALALAHGRFFRRISS